MALASPTNLEDESQAQTRSAASPAASTSWPQSSVSSSAMSHVPALNHGHDLVHDPVHDHGDDGGQGSNQQTPASGDLSIRIRITELDDCNASHAPPVDGEADKASSPPLMTAGHGDDAQANATATAHDIVTMQSEPSPDPASAPIPTAISNHSSAAAAGTTFSSPAASRSNSSSAATSSAPSPHPSTHTNLSSALPRSATPVTTPAQVDSPPAHYHAVFQPIPHSSLGIKQRETDSGESSAGRRDKMLFGEIHKPILAHRRRVLATSNALTPYEADLTSKDRTKQKEAVKRYLAEKVKNDWEWVWPRQPRHDVEDDADSGDAPAENNLEVDEYAAWRDRSDWLSELGDSDDESTAPVHGSVKSNDDLVDPQQRALTKRRQRWQKDAEEMTWNDGLKCFTKRRNAWTLARPAHSSVQATSTPEDDANVEDTDASVTTEVEMDMDVQIPIAQPLLPPENPMRSSIGPSAYNTIYDKVILQGLTPACPINLQDVMSACVQGWKRDGEWPPRPTPVEAPISSRKPPTRRKLSLSGILGFEKDKSKDLLTRIPSTKEVSETTSGPKSPTAANKNTFRRSFQKVFGLGHNPVASGQLESAK